MKIVLDTAILIRGHGSSKGLARDLPLSIVESDHILPLSNEMLYELAKVLRYPRMLALHGLSEKRIYDYVGFRARRLRSWCQILCYSRRFAM